MPCEWDEIAWQKTDDSFAVKKEGKYGIVDRAGRLIAQPVWDRLAFSSVPDMICAEKDGKFCYIDRRGNIVLMGAWEEAEAFSAAGLAWVYANGKYGFVKPDGQFAFPMQSRALYTYFDAENQCVLYESGRMWGYMNAQGQVLCKVNYDSLVENGKQLFEGLCVVGNKESQWGYMDAQGEMVIPFQYHNAENFSSGFAFVSTNGKTYGVINAQGEKITDEIWATHEQYRLLGDQLLALVSYGTAEDRQRGYINTQGEIVCGIKLP